MAFKDISKFTMWVGIIGLLWNLMGLAAFFSQMTMDLSALPEPQQAFYGAMPIWAKAGFFIAAVGGVLGCVGLLLGAGWARIVFALSIVGLLVQNVHAFLLGNGLAVFGTGAVVMPIFVLAVAIYLYYYSSKLAPRAEN